MNKDHIRYLADLSYIELTDEEKDEFLTQLKEIFLHVEDVMSDAEYASIDTAFIEEHYLDNIDDDVIRESSSREEMLLNAKREKNGFVLVPKIIKGDR